MIVNNAPWLCELRHFAQIADRDYVRERYEADDLGSVLAQYKTRLPAPQPPSIHAASAPVQTATAAPRVGVRRLPSTA